MKGYAGHRKNQPAPIDTFNIVSNRRKSLVKQVNEANANSDAIINKSYVAIAQTANSQSFAEGSFSAQKGVKLPEISSNSKSGLNQYRNSGTEGFSHANTQKLDDFQSNYNSIIQTSMDPTVLSASGSKDGKRRTTSSIFQAN